MLGGCPRSGCKRGSCRSQQVENRSAAERLRQEGAYREGAPDECAACAGPPEISHLADYQWNVKEMLAENRQRATIERQHRIR